MSAKRRLAPAVSDLDLLQRCETCSGEGTVRAEYPDGGWTDDRPCRRCRGTGLIPTEQAAPLVSLIKHVMWMREGSQK